MSERGKILIIDDNPKNIQILAYPLKEQGYDIEIGISGEEALNHLSYESFDLLLLDIMMPKMNGYDTCKIIRADKTHAAMPIIFISAKNDTQSMVQGFEVGGQDYISKPFDRSELLARVKTHIELKQNREELQNYNASLENKIKENTEDLRKANNELRLISNTKDKYLSFIGKEVNAPLKSINQAVSMIKQSAESTRLSEIIKILSTSVGKLEHITQMAEHITQIKTDSLTPIPKEFGLLSCIEYILTVASKCINEKDIKFHIDVDNKLKIKGNNELIKKSISGIINIILKYINSNQLISIRAKKQNETDELIIESTINEWYNLESNFVLEEALLYSSYAETIMAFQEGKFIIDDNNHPQILFKWIFMNHPNNISCKKENQYSEI